MKALHGAEIRVRGTVQGVGFRPFVWRLARELGLRGEVRNDGAGVLVRAWGDSATVDALARRILAEAPPLARIESLHRRVLKEPARAGDFRIVASVGDEVHTGVAPDAAACAACLAEIGDPRARRYRHAFANCTHCGPRLSIVRAIPWDRANTSMAAFAMCHACGTEYGNPADRRFHAQPIACPACGPRVWLADVDGRAVDPGALGAVDAIAAASRLLAAGHILALKGIGGFHLACDAHSERAVAQLRLSKQRPAKPFALMARDAGVIARYARLDAAQTACLRSPAAPIVLLEAHAEHALAPAIAPGQRTLGFMLPYSPLHQLLFADLDTPLVMTSGNRSDEPPCICNEEARQRLAGVADYWLLHDREIVNRLDDSVLRFADGAPRLLRRARGYAPAPIALHRDFAAAPELLALGGELKSTVCLLRAGQAVPSQHLGDLGNAATSDEFEITIARYLDLYRLRPELLVVDAHPDYRSRRHGEAWSGRAGITLLTAQHHHAHVASALAENGRAPDAPPVLGVVLDGMGYGSDGTLWGGEFLLADYRECRRLGHLAATALPGGSRAMVEPWRNAWAQIERATGTGIFLARWGGLEFARWLAGKPLATLGSMLRQGLNCPPSSSCGRLFDAVAAVLGICRDGIGYEGQAAIELEALAGGARRETAGYAFACHTGADPCVLDPAPLWEQIFADLGRGVARSVIAARFHHGLAAAVAALAEQLAAAHGLDTVALSGGVFQNRLLLEGVAGRLRGSGLAVLAQREVPANDGGLSLGQAAIGAAYWLHPRAVSVLKSARTGVADAPEVESGA